MTNRNIQHSLQANAIEFAASNYFFTCLEKEYKMHFYLLSFIDYNDDAHDDDMINDDKNNDVVFSGWPELLLLA